MTDEKPVPAKPEVKINRATVPKDRTFKVAPHAMRPQNAREATWTVELTQDEATRVTMEDLLRPSAWAHHAAKLDPKFHYTIVVVSESHDIYARFYVRAVQENQIIVDVIDPLRRFGPQNVEIMGSLKPKWNVGKNGWDVVRTSDNQIVMDGSKFKVKEQALQWIEDQKKQFGT